MLVSTYGLRWSESEAHVLSIQLHKRKGARFHVSGISAAAARSLMARIHASFETLGLPRPYGAFTLHISPPILGPCRGLDLPVALTFLAVSGIVPTEAIKHLLSYGNIGLNGALEEFDHMGNIALSSRIQTQSTDALIAHCQQMILPKHAARQFIESASQYHEVRTCDHLQQMVLFLNKKTNLPLVKMKSTWHKRIKWLPSSPSSFEQLEASDFVKKALVVAASGAHHTLILGSPGTGKSLMAQCIHDLLPPLSEIEFEALNLLAQLKGETLPLTDCPPFRQPHCHSSASAIIGSFQQQQAVPGECSLAAGGVLCLDEFPEFSRDCIESLRSPLEAMKISLAKAQGTAQWPLTSIIVATGNPCPCGFVHDRHKRCACSAGAVKNYMRRISGPIAERFHIHLETSLPTDTPVTHSVEQPSLFRNLEHAREIVLAIRHQRQTSNNWTWAPSSLALLQSTKAIHSHSKRNDHILKEIAGTHEQVLAYLKTNDPHVKEIGMESLHFALQLRIFNRPNWWHGGFDKRWPQFASSRSTEI